MNPSGTGAPERELQRRKGSCTLESHLPGERSNEPEESPDAEKSVAVSWSTEKLIKNPMDHLNYGHSHQKLRCLGGGWAPNPRLQRLVPGLGGRGRAETAWEVSKPFDGAETAWETRKQSCRRGREQYSRGGEVESRLRGNLGESLVCAPAGEGREEGVGPYRTPPTPQQAYRPAS